MNTFSEHPVTVYKLPLPQNISILYPEQAILDFGNRGTLDIGALCYLIRKPNARRNKKDEGKPVLLSSLSQPRTKVVEYLIQHISDKIKQGNKNASTIYGAISYGLLPFIDWADQNNLSAAIHDKSTARQAFKKFNEHMRERVMHREISQNTGARMTRQALESLCEFLNIDDLHRGINLIPRKEKDTNITEPPHEGSQARFLSLCDSIFNGLTTFLTENQPYPYKLAMPKYLGWERSELWVFPLKKWFSIPSKTLPHSNEQSFQGYNFSQGRISTLDEMSKNTTRHAGQQSIRNAQAQLEKANSDKDNYFRRNLGIVAQNAFFQIFLANTGLNLAQAKDLKWEESFDVSSSRRGFRILKWRAGGRIQSIEIQAVFLPLFKRFLKLREYLLRGQSHPYLFGNYGANTAGNPKRITYSPLDNFYRTLRTIDPNLPRITSRQWRAANSDWMLRNKVPVKIAATILQNSEKVLEDSYAAGSSATQMSEMSAFLNRVSSVVLDEKISPANFVEGPVGGCVQYGSPQAIESSIKIKPNCRSAEGCLFCDKYKVHADEKDIRKLISCQYCINKTSSLSTSIESFENAFSPILERIRRILDEISIKMDGTQVVERIRHSVEVMGELDNYWEGKLELLIHLDLVSP